LRAFSCSFDRSNGHARVNTRRISDLGPQHMFSKPALKKFISAILAAIKVFVQAVRGV
jgi:hypothetical protein